MGAIASSPNPAQEIDLCGNRALGRAPTGTSILDSATCRSAPWARLPLRRTRRKKLISVEIARWGALLPVLRFWIVPPVGAPHGRDCLFAEPGEKIDLCGNRALGRAPTGTSILDSATCRSAAHRAIATRFNPAQDLICVEILYAPISTRQHQTSNTQKGFMNGNVHV